MAPAGFAGAIPPLPRRTARTRSEQAVRAIAPTAAEIVVGSLVRFASNRSLRNAASSAFWKAATTSSVTPAFDNGAALHATRPDVARSCPECRAPSHFVVPSSVHVDGPRKAQLVKAHLSRLRAIPCKHFAYGEGTCPFGTSCFFAHTDREGKQSPSVSHEPPSAKEEYGPPKLPAFRLSLPRVFAGDCGRSSLSLPYRSSMPSGKYENLEGAGEAMMAKTGVPTAVALELRTAFAMSTPKTSTWLYHHPALRPALAFQVQLHES